jgi:hypothetical protein
MALLKAHAQPSSGDQRVIAAGARRHKDQPAIQSKIGLMLPEADILAAASVMKRYGASARLEAATRADRFC